MKTITYLPRNHMVNIVTIEDQKYLVDVGFGSNNPHFLIPLKHGVVRESPFCFKASRERIPDLSSTNAGQELWVYEYWHIGLKRFMPGYCFTEAEFTPADFEVMNLWTSTSRTSFFTYTVLCTKMILGEDEQPFPTIVGHITLVGDKVKQVLEGESEVLVTLSSERDRIRALKKHLDIILSEAEKNGIRGMVTELV
jgi:arylamine N-acetyltransferase